MEFKPLPGLCLVLSILSAAPAAVHSKEKTVIEFLSTEQILGIAWNNFLGALRSGNDKAIRAACTRGGFQSLVSSLDQKKPRGPQCRDLGQQASQWGMIHWSITSIVAYARVGPQQDISVSFVRTPEGWKLDQWSPAG